MKLVELLHNQEIIIQLVWDKHKIEFISKVIEKDETSIYVTPYIHNGHELELNVASDNNVVCNIFADDPANKQRISWKGLSLTTVNRADKTVYCLNAHGYNAVSTIDERRLHERIKSYVEGHLFDGEDGDISITLHDISDNGIAFYVPGYFEPKSQQFNVSFTDSIDDRIFNISIVCAIARISNEENRTLVGCRVLDDNNYRVYELLKRLRMKNYIVVKNEENANTHLEDKREAVVA